MRAAAVLLAILALAPAAAAQLLRPTPGSGQVGFELVGARTGGDASSLEARQWMQLGLGGGLMGGSLLRYRLTVRPGWQQGSLTGVDGDLGGRTFGLAASADLLPGRPVSLRLGATRADGRQGAGFGNERQFLTAAQTADVSWRNRFFPMRLGWRRQVLDDTWHYADRSAPRRLANAHRTLRLTASSSKTSVALERQWFDDRVGVEDFSAWSFLATHALRWGRGSRLETLVERSGQNGTRGTARAVWSERLHLQHARRVSSDWSWRRSAMTLGAWQSRSHAVDGAFNVRVADWGSGALQGGVASAGAAAAYRTWRLGPRLGVNVLAGPWRFGVSVAVGGEWRRGTGSTDTLAQVVDERHTVGPGRAIQLDQPDAVATGLVVRGPDGLVLLEGVDYRAIPFGDRLRLEFPLDGRVPDGVTVTVSYAHVLPRISSRNAARLDADLWATWDGVSVRYAESRRSIAEGRAEDAFLERRASLDVRRPTRLGRVGVGLVVRGRESGMRPRTVATEVDLNLQRPLGRHAALNGALTWSRAVEAGDSAVVVTAGSGGASWVPVSGLRLQGLVAATIWRGTLGDRQAFVTFTTDLDWRVAGLDLHARWDATRRDQVGVLWLHRVSANLTRRF